MSAVAVPAAGPFPGLTPFGETDEDALLFFGREREREVIAANLLASRLTVLYGASGVGKSSVLRAGVAHHLRTMARRNLETRGHPEFAVVVFDEWTGDPANALLAAVQDELREVFGDRAPADRAATLTDTLHDWSGRLQCELLLILDQTEEYFLYHEQEEGSRTFAGELPDLVTRPGLPVSVLLAIRDDALSRLDRFKGRIPNLFANYLRLDHLDRRAGRAAIVGPIEQFNRLHGVDPPLAIEPALVETLLDETTTGRVHLGRRGRGVVRRPGARTRIEAPYLQLVLQRLWEEEHVAGSNVLRLETLERLGGANEVVRTHLERALAPLPLDEKDVAADVFSHLVTPSGTKIAHGLHDLAEYAHVDDERLEPIVSSLVRHRILRPVARRAEEDAADGTPYEIFHDVLGEAVLAWRTAHESERRVALERAEAHRRQRRILGILGLAFVALLAMAAVAGYALDKRAEARTAAARATQQAAIAVAAQKKAEKSEARAVAARVDAVAARKDAEMERDATQAAKDDADAQRAIADERTAVAVVKTRIANAALARARNDRAFAVLQTDRAVRARKRADDATADARAKHRQTVRALLAQQRATRLAQARELTALAREYLRINPVVTIQRALEAAQLRRAPDVEDVLRDGLIDVRLQSVIRGGGPLVDAVYSADGAIIVTGASDPRGTAKVVTTRPFRVVHTLRHGAPIHALALSRDGSLLATAGVGGTIRVWETATGRVRLPLEHGGTTVLDVEFSPDGRLLASGGNDRSAQLWELAGGLRLHRFAHQQTVRMVRFDPLGRFLVSTPLLAERFARVWDLATGGQVAALEHANAPTSAQFTPDGDNVLTTGTRNLFLWNVGSWSRPAVTMVGHHVTLRGASINADSTRAVSWDDAGIGRVWRLDTGAQITMLIRHENSVESAVFARDGTTVLTASSDLTARIWTGTISELRTSLVGHRDRVVSAVYAPDRESILTASTDGTARIWQSLAEPLLAPLGTARHEGGATALDVSPDGTIAASGGGDGRILIWRTRGGLRRALEQGGRITAVRFSADGKLLCTASSNGTIRLWRVADGASVRTIDVGSAVRTAALSPDGRWIAAAAGRLVLVYGADGARRGVVSHDGDVRAVSFAPNGTRVLSGGGDADARLSNLDGTVVARLGGHEGSVTTVAYSPDGKLVATGSEDGVLRVWPSSGVGNAQELEVAGEPLTSVRFDARSTRIVAATDEGQIRSWTLGSNPKMTAYQGHVSVVNDARFSPDGRWIVSAGPTAAGVFFVASGKRVYLLRGHGQLLTTATFTKDSRRIVSAGTDGTVRTFVCAVCGSLDELRALAKRRLAQIDRIG